MSLMSRLRHAARSAEEATIEFEGRGTTPPNSSPSPSASACKGRTAECVVPPDRPGVLVVRFKPSVRPA